MDYMACVSQGVYPTPTPTAKERMTFGISFGLIDFVLGEDLTPDVIANTFFRIVRGGAKLFTEGAKIFLRR